MITTRLQNIVLLALAAISFGITSARGQAANTSDPGEILLGFRATANTGLSKNYEIDLGPASTFRDYTTVQTLPLTGVSADLSSTYGADWHSRTDVLWGAVASIGGAALRNDTAETLYATKAETTNGVTAAPWVSRGSSGQTSITSVIDTARNGFNLATAAPNASAIAKLMNTSDGNNWSQFQPGGTSSNGISFQNWNPTIEGTPSQYLDLFQLPPVSLQQGIFVGRMILNGDGSMTFIPAALVGQSTVQLSAATYTAAEDAGTLTVTVSRAGDTTVAGTVNLSTSDGATGAAINATAPTDYTAITNQAVTFNAGDTSVTVPVTIANRSGLQGDRSFTVTLSGPGTGVTIGTQSSATATITEASVPSSVVFTSAVYSTSQGSASITIGLTRSGGSDSVSVTVTPSTITPFSVSGDNATSGTDYSATPQTVTFAANSNTATATIALPTDAGLTKQIQFHVTATSSTSNPTIGTQGTAIVRLLQADTAPPAVTVTTPSTATIAEQASHTLPISGTATDTKGIIDHVSITLNGTAVTPVTLTPSTSGAGYSATLHPVGGLNTVQVQAVDASGNASPIVTKTFTYVEKRALSVVVSPNSTVGSVTGLKPGVVYQVGSTLSLTAVAKTGYIFDHWSGTGLSGMPTQVAALSVPFTDAIAGAMNSTPVITANFIANPFLSLVGNFNGLVVADNASVASNSTNGLVTVSLLSGGTFTGTLKIDGLPLVFSGLFDNTGVAKFGPTRSTVLQVARVTKPAYNLSLSLNFTTKQITGTLDQVYRNAVVSNSVVTADRAFYSATNLVPSNYLANKGLYNVAFPAHATQTGLTSADYPQGDGYGTITVTSIGNVTLSGVLADGTKVSASSFLRKPTGSLTANAVLFAQLAYTTPAGSLGGVVNLDDSQTNTDVAGTNFFWFRPWQNKVQYYPWGWPDGIQVDLAGTKLLPVSKTVSAVLGLQNLIPNATLTFTNGQLASTQTKNVTITTNVVANYPTSDTSVKLTVTAATGLISGTFLHTNGTRPAFVGTILQKGANSGAFGYFLTVSPKVIDGTGESGSVTLFHK